LNSPDERVDCYHDYILEKSKRSNQLIKTICTIDVSYRRRKLAFPGSYAAPGGFSEHIGGRTGKRSKQFDCQMATKLPIGSEYQIIRKHKYLIIHNHLIGQQHGTDLVMY